MISFLSEIRIPSIYHVTNNKNYIKTFIVCYGIGTFIDTETCFYFLLLVSCFSFLVFFGNDFLINFN